jgi:transformation/transcription domain-associated protein
LTGFLVGPFFVEVICLRYLIIEYVHFHKQHRPLTNFYLPLLAGHSEEANKAFSAATQTHDTLIKAWALWGDYLEHIFTSREPRRMDIGVSAMTCYLHGCRQQNETKSRKYLAKVLWLLSFDDEEMSLMKTLDKYAVGVPPLHWLPWIPQLLCCLVQYKGNVILNLLNQVGRMYPQAVYFPIRTLYLTLRIEQRERYNSVEQNSAQKGATVGVAKPPQANGAGGETATSTPQQPTITVTTTTQQTPAAGGSQGATPSGTDPTNHG